MSMLPTPYLLLDQVSYRFPSGGLALKEISFRIYAGQFTALIGRSGSGKTTLARLISGQLRSQAGAIYLNGQQINHLGKAQRRRKKLGMQMIFQDPAASLHPLFTVARQLEEPLLVQGGYEARERKAKVLDMLDEVGLDPGLATRLPAQLSGGQQQRVAIGAAMITKPALLIADEALSSLDFSVRAQILNLLQDLRSRYQFACLWIAHDPDSIAYLCDRVAVLDGGRIVEEDKLARVFQRPKHPTTRALLLDDD